LADIRRGLQLWRTTSNRFLWRDQGIAPEQKLVGYTVV
jgi:hypothetical protein